MILSEFIWFNLNIKLDSKHVHLSFFLTKNLHFISQLFNDNGNIKPWEYIKLEFHLKDIHKIYWLQIIDALPKTWKDIILKDKGNTKNLAVFDHHLARKSQILGLSKLTSKEYTVTSTAQNYFETLLESLDFNWKKNIFSNS